ncbi:hypothetical protein B7P43_G08420 [Cryptotermes secundus]|uniref:Uncharacterized protein n=1 Tax=Cryptotermes secundus TaxID=105785 RepID=A0A2J7QNM9_9NEOP|nr:ankyrin repeat domain-containing protein 54 [Cryptotermes secundus]PNF30196.1 hypothetical protein B7P43_G08420 [Cryptotermes secundus]
MNKIGEQASAPVEIKKNPNGGFRQSLHTGSSSLEVDPPAGLRFCNLQPLSFGLGNGYEVEDSLIQHDLQRRRRRVFRFHLKSRRDAWFHHKEYFDTRRLHLAASTNNVNLMETLLRSGVNPNCKDDQSRSSLHLAACRGYHDIVRLLLERGADPNSKDSLGNTPLHLAACTNNVAVVTLLLKAGTDVSSIDYCGRSPLQLAHSKLRLLQRSAANTEDSKLVKDEAHQVIEMMLTYLHKCGQDTEAELLGAFSSRLTLSNTREEVETGVRDLLAGLSSLSLDKSVSDQKDCTEK